MTEHAGAAASALFSRRPHLDRRLFQTEIKDYFSNVESPKSASHIAPDQNAPAKIIFLDLPHCIRERIYKKAIIGGDKFINLNFWSIKQETWKDHDCQPLCRIPACVAEYRRHDNDHSSFFEKFFPAALLRVGSRIIRHEVQAMLYVCNSFAVSLQGPNGLQSLENLGDVALGELRVLVVSLRPYKCLVPFCSKINRNYGECGVWPRPRSEYSWNEFTQLAKGTRSRPIGSQSRTDKATLAR